MKQLITTSIAAPGFYGLNTQESSITLASGFALTASNCVIDSYGRLGSRKGWEYRTTGSTGVNLVGLHEFVNNAGASEYISWGGNKVYTGHTTLVEKTPITNSTITADNWQGVTLNNNAYMFQRGHDPLIKVSGVATMQRMMDSTNATAVPQAHCALSAYGRLWAADVVGDNHTVHFSALLTVANGGVKWGGTDGSGSLDIAKAWTKGGDSIVSLAAFNGFLIIFCKNSIVIFGDTDANNNYLTPSTLRLVEVIEGVGCIARDSVQTTGTDIMFLSKTGVRSLNRVIQEKSTPIGDISKNVRDEITSAIANESVDSIRSVYSPRNAFYLLNFSASGNIYCFDTRVTLEDGSARVTKWENTTHKAMIATSDNKVYIAQVNGIAEYYSYLDNGVSYRMRYYTNYFDFDQPTTVKILKSIGITLIGGSGQPFVVYSGTDYTDQYNPYVASVKQTALYEYDAVGAEYGEAEYTGGGGTDRIKLSIGGSGAVVQLGFETDISGDEVSIQKFDLYIKQGRTL